MKYFYYLLFLFLVGCVKEHEPKIEIYLLKEKIASDYGIPVSSMAEYTKMDEIEKRLYRFTRYDTINKELIDGGPFKVSLSDLNDNPLIEDKDIVAFNVKDEYVTLTEEGYSKIKSFQVPCQTHQVAITANKKVILTAYIRSDLSSQNLHWYQIPTSYSGNLSDKTKPYKSLRINFGSLDWNGKEVVPKPPYPKEFLEAFRKTNRLKE
ncbi:hypothetical protein AM493_10955 [Flavobacterium akiainvivens]|uniref:Uncharacterized protein n=1 Tax=Flavobacterium akiainvivens TaxID=1202724 RepID=A0A0M8MBA2_9FLAO|nr:hypothetical protein [Flavobacterium akiainvivens]KOS06495.1 hypothetical protein AM493_10955 [Flavobacterium akiainvivens]SFQ12114.1 hypothetical protein SAMN05444144_101169 [Flavobacterium akiainvivens]